MLKKQIMRICSATALAAVVLCTVAVARDFSAEEIEEWHTAAEQGEGWAQYNLGLAYGSGNGVREDKREAVRWWHKAAEQGDASAQFNLGVAYGNGEGVAVDKREAVRWYRKAAEQGEAKAQSNLGNAYYFGEGIAVDQREAVRWYRKAAEQGLASAQYNLGNAYYFGEGIAVDQREAVRRYRKAAEQGLASAQFNLGVSYWNGEGVIADQRETYIWYSIAKANGDEEAAERLRKLNWHKYLSQAEIQSARKEAARRLEAIDRNKEESEQETAIALKPKDTNIAERVFENTWRSVVVVHNGNSQGSGIIVRPNIVATNCHVVDERGKITVYKADNRRADTDTTFSATIRHSDESKDFCLLAVNGLWGVPVTVRKYGTLGIGEDVYGLGAPKGFDLSLSDGVISQLRESGGDRLIQTNVPISPGSSGGGLFDSNGNLVGIMTSKITDEETEGIGFAIPADLVLGH